MTNILRKAAESLPGHWMKGDLTDGNGNFCAVGHMYQAAGANEYCLFGDSSTDVDKCNAMQAQWDFAAGMLNEFTNGEFYSVPYFNDAASTTEDDVIAFLEKAANKWDETQAFSD